MLGVKDMDRISQFEFNIDGSLFRIMFVHFGGTEHMAEHIWSKFNGYKHSIVKTFGHLDDMNREIVVKMVNAWKGYNVTYKEFTKGGDI